MHDDEKGSNGQVGMTDPGLGILGSATSPRQRTRSAFLLPLLVSRGRPRVANHHYLVHCLAGILLPIIWRIFASPDIKCSLAAWPLVSS